MFRGFVLRVRTGDCRSKSRSIRCGSIARVFHLRIRCRPVMDEFSMDRAGITMGSVLYQRIRNSHVMFGRKMSPVVPSGGDDDAGVRSCSGSGCAFVYEYCSRVRAWSMVPRRYSQSASRVWLAIEVARSIASCISRGKGSSGRTLVRSV
jgi:hypothetical protein